MQKRSEKAKKFINSFVRILLIVAIFIELYTQNWVYLFVTTLTLILTFLPDLFEKKYKINIPEILEVITVIFIFSSLYLGEVRAYYTKFWWWDIFLHGGAAVGLGLVGFMILFVLYQGRKIKAKPIWISLFSFCFAVAIGTIWEIFEFSIDSFLELNMQKSGLIDTMWDLIVDTMGAFIASLIGWIYLKKGKILDKTMKEFIESNPELFKK